MFTMRSSTTRLRAHGRRHGVRDAATRAHTCLLLLSGAVRLGTTSISVRSDTSSRSTTRTRRLSSPAAMSASTRTSRESGLIAGRRRACSTFRAAFRSALSRTRHNNGTVGVELSCEHACVPDLQGLQQRLVVAQSLLTALV